MINQNPKSKGNKTYDKKNFKNACHTNSNFLSNFYLIRPHPIYTFNIKIIFIKSYNH